jgi:hypothetical protein
VAVEVAGESGFGVVGGHPDRVGDLLGLGVEPHHVRGEVAELDAGGSGCRGGFGVAQFAIGGLDWGLQGVEQLVGEEDGLPGGGAAQLEQRGVAGGLCCCGGGFGLPGAGGGGLFRWAGYHPVRVVRRGGVGVERVEGVEGEVGARTAEVVLFAPPC